MSGRQGGRAALGVLLTVLVAACASAGGDPPPEEIALGLDACEYCHMSIDDPDRAAEWVEAGGHAHKFDEPGCLLAWLQRNPGTGGRAFVADLEGGGWVAAERATLLHGAIRTSMGFDIVAFRDAQAAKRRADARGGSVRSWPQLTQEGVKDVHAR